MKSPTSRPDRRAFLQGALLAGSTLAGGSALSAFAAASLGPSAPPDSPRVVIARDGDLRLGGVRPDAGRLRQLLDRALCTFFDRDSAVEAWRQVVRPGQRVGLKINCLAGLGLSTDRTLTDAIIGQLNEAGIRERDIIVWDRLDQDLERGGFPVVHGGSGVRYIGNDAAGYESELSIFGRVGSLLSRTLTRECDVVINLPLLKDHGITGMTGALKNVFGAIHNPNKYHLDMGNPYIADVWMLPDIRRKFQLHVCDLTTLQYQGGPSYLPEWTLESNSLMIARDPLALDRIGLDLIDRVRREQGLEALTGSKRHPHYLETAADQAHRIGCFDLERISFIEV